MSLLPFLTYSQNTAYLQGYVIDDFNNNCIANLGEDSLKNYIITLKKGAFTQTVSTDENGYYTISVDTGIYDIMITGGSPYKGLCSSAQTVSVPIYASVNHNLPLQVTNYCPHLEINIGSKIHFNNDDNTFTIQYCNKGTITANQVYVKVKMDPIFLDTFEYYHGASTPPIDSIGNIYIFSLPNLPPDTCGSFKVATWPMRNKSSRTACIQAEIFAGNTCNLWTGASLAIQANCHNDSVSFRILNKGQQAMSNARSYTIIENNSVLHTSSPISVASGNYSPWFSYPSTGSSYRFEIEQDSGYPWGKKASATIEGCLDSNSSNTIITGFVNDFPLDNQAPNIAIDCQTIVDSIEQYYKQAFPVGYSNAHYITPNDEILYRINISNTDFLYPRNITIKDTLSPFLDISTIKPLTASRPYKWKILEGNIIEITFENIYLTNIANSRSSQLFVDFKIKQQANNPLGTIINNKAAIYFDRNAPIITNTVFHTIDENFMIFTALPTVEQGDALSIKAFPNPFDQATTLQVEGNQTYEVLHLQVYNSLGQLVGQATNQNGTPQIHFQRKNLETGIYFYRLEGDGAFLHAGQLIVR